MVTTMQLAANHKMRLALNVYKGGAELRKPT